VTRHDARLLERAARIRLLVLDVDGVLTDGRLYFDSQGNETKAFYTQDGLGLKAVQQAGITLALVSGRASRMVTDRATALGIEHVYQGRGEKLGAYLDLLHKTGVRDDEVCFVGDDWIDLPILCRVGLAVAVPEAAGAVLEHVHWVTTRPGGFGAVRELCELLLDAQGQTEHMLKAYL
jgi:3-deoxy-D-manno-octulosonate 8-phosphate phosphatase (KDO 8-P phosphatase)